MRHAPRSLGCINEQEEESSGERKEVDHGALDEGDEKGRKKKNGDEPSISLTLVQRR